MRSWIFAAVLAFAAAPALAEPMPPPIPEGTAVQIDAGQSGQTVEVAQGDSFSITLQSNPSTGSSWVRTEKPDFVDDSGHESGPVTAPPANGRPMVGGAMWQVYLFTATGTGSGPISYELRGPGGVLRGHFTVTINAQ